MFEINSETSASKSTRVMVIDDDIEQLELISAFLENANYKVTHAESAETALNQLKSGSVDIVITDICMPEMNGWQFVQNLRKLSGHESTPVVLMTSGGEFVAMPNSKFRADAFYLKSKIKESLLPVIDNLCKIN